jgi:prepilin-type N-terminal cleavage/methylation domain-containing protein
MKNAKIRNFTILNSRRAGFTLIEIMIALVIIGGLITVILQTINNHANVAYEQTIVTKMFLIARENIAKMELTPKNSKGIIEGTDFVYENLIIPTEDEDIIELKTIISGHGKEVTLSELIFSKEYRNEK